MWEPAGLEASMKARVFPGLISMLLATLIPATASAPAAPDVDKESAFRWLDANADAMRKVSLNIWNAAEIAMHEYKSSRELMAYLESNGFHVEKGVAGMPTAFIGSYGSGKTVIAIYGEYDALAGLSQKAEASFSPVVEGASGHGCGHNLIGASSAAAAVAVSKLMETGKIKGTLRFYGTPAEESIGGKTYMLQAGLFNDVDVLLGWHPQDVTTASFQYSKAVASVRFKFKGVAAHASSAPQVGRSALKGVELLDVGVNFAREHLKEDARIHSVITNGGGQPNVVPAQAESWYYIRANKHEDVADMVEWVSEIARGAAMMTRTQVEIVVDDDTYELLPNRPSLK
jgi:aminobenzoyl-glutamate utilization protein B